MYIYRNLDSIYKIAIGFLTVSFLCHTPISLAKDVDEEENPFLPKVFKEEGITQLPDVPKMENLKQFTVNGGSSLKFFIDTKSIKIGNDDVIRYVVVIKSPSGAEQAKLEGLRCETFEYKLYATLGEDGKWKPVNASEWKFVPNLGYNQYQATLGRGGLCFGTGANSNFKSALDSLP